MLRAWVQRRGLAYPCPGDVRVQELSGETEACPTSASLPFIHQRPLQLPLSSGQWFLQGTAELRECQGAGQEGGQQWAARATEPELSTQPVIYSYC